jgi:class 3 adenylate cyclase
MAAVISRKKHLSRFLVPLIVMIGSLFALINLFEGPRLGFLYDFLAECRRAPPVSPAIVLIETGLVPENRGAAAGQFVDPVTAAQVILTLTEMDASALVMQTPVLGMSSGNAKTEEELRARFYDEFSLLEQNIRNLFQGIRTGSIAPGESERYVADLVQLAELGKERLIASFLDKDETDTAFLERAVRAFDNVWLGGDTPEEGVRRYSRARPDGDGVFRRIAPVLPAFPEGGNDGADGVNNAAGIVGGADGIEHIAYAAVKGRFRRAELEREGTQTRVRLSGSGGENVIALDRGGNILPEKPRDAAGFKRVSLAVFLAYEQAERELLALLRDAESRGYFACLDPEDYPVTLYHYSSALREEMLERPDAGRKSRWTDSRKRYLKSVENYLDGLSETSLAAGYEKLIAGEQLAGAGLDRLVTMRNEMIDSFRRVREKYGEFSSLRAEISAASASASVLCVMGPVSAPRPALENSNTLRGILSLLGKNVSPLKREANPTDAEASAMLINSILTGRSIIPAPDLHLFLWSAGIALGILFLLRKTGPLFTVIAGSLLILLEALMFSLGFVFTGIWLDPLLPALTAASGVFASFFMAIKVKNGEIKQFRLAYGPSLPPPCLRQVIRSGHPRPGEFLKAKAAIITVRQPSLLSVENREDPEAGAALLRDFRQAVFRHFSRFGGVFIGAEGDTVMIAFGSPPERVYLDRVKSEVPYNDEINARGGSPAAKAAAAVMDFAARPSEADWYFGIDAGECVFGWTESGGCAAFGSPLVRSKLLAGLAPRYKARILAAAAVVEEFDGVTSGKLGVFREKNGKQEAFYRLLAGEAKRRAF